MAFKLKNQSPGIQFIVFFCLTIGMIVAFMSISTFYFGDLTNLITDKPLTPAQLATVKLSQAITTIMIFMVPSLVYAYLSDEKPLNYLGLKPGLRFSSLAIILLLLVAVQPFTMLVNEFTQRMNVPDGLRKLEELNNKALSKFLVMNSPKDLLVNFLVVALLPAIAEELFFRGSLQNILERWTGRPAVAVILSSAFFAIFHLSIFKVLSIFILGATLGLIFYITRNLWYCIFFHLVNNSLALLQNYYASRSQFIKDLSNDDVKMHWSIGLISLLLTIGLFMLLRRKNPGKPLEKTWHQDVFRNHFNTPS